MTDSTVTAIQTTISDLEILISTVIAVSMVVISYLFAIRQYFIQRVHEHYRNRYLDNGVDALASQIEEALQIFRHNWSNGETVLKQFRDLREKTDPSICDRFIELDHKTFKIIPTFRVQTLVQDPDNIIWLVQQDLFAFVKISTDFFSSDVGSLVRVYLKHKGTIPGKGISVDELLQKYFEEFEKMDERAKNYYALLIELAKIADEFGNVKRLTKSEIDTFHNRPVIKKIVERLRQQYASILPS